MARTILQIKWWYQENYEYVNLLVYSVMEY